MLEGAFDAEPGREVSPGNKNIGDFLTYRGQIVRADGIKKSDLLDPDQLKALADNSRVMSWIKRVGLATGTSLGIGIAALAISQVSEFKIGISIPGINIDPQTQLNALLYGKSAFWGGLLGRYGAGRFIGERVSIAWVKTRIDLLNIGPVKEVGFSRWKVRV